MRYTIIRSTNKSYGTAGRSIEVPLLLGWRGGIHIDHGPRHVAMLLSAARFVYSIGAMAATCLDVL
jgi:hypothetical protein